MADQERVDADPDPTFRAADDPDPKCLAIGRRKNVLKNLQLFFPKSTKLFMCNFLSNK